MPTLPIHQVRRVGKRGGTAYLLRLGDDAINICVQVVMTLMHIVQVRGVGKRGGTAYLFRLGDDLINFGALHGLLAASVPEMMPVAVAELLVDGAQKTGEPPIRHFVFFWQVAIHECI